MQQANISRGISADITGLDLITLIDLWQKPIMIIIKIITSTTEIITIINNKLKQRYHHYFPLLYCIWSGPLNNFLTLLLFFYYSCCLVSSPFSPLYNNLSSTGSYNVNCAVISEQTLTWQVYFTCRSASFGSSLALPIILNHQ